MEGEELAEVFDGCLVAESEPGTCDELGMGLCSVIALLAMRGVDWAELDWLLAPLLSALANRDPILSQSLNTL